MESLPQGLPTANPLAESVLTGVPSTTQADEGNAGIPMVVKVGAGVFVPVREKKMKRLLILILLLFVLISIHSELHAGGLIVRLPEDGVEVRYKIQYENAPGRGLGGMQFMTIRSVGKVTHRDKPCRWIEFGFLGGKTFYAKKDSHMKILVPESELIKGGEPLAHVIKGFLSPGNFDAEPQAIPKVIPISKTLLPILLAPVGNKVVPLEAIQVNTGLGNLQCQGSKGTGVFIDKSIEDDRVAEAIEKNTFKVTADMEYRFHDKVPFGVAQLRLAMVVDPGGKSDKVNMTIIFTAEKISTGVVSAMPDSK
jgi:hypothetical protein